jgi:hypothetical protein
VPSRLSTLSASRSAAAKALAQAYPDLVDKSRDGPISVEDIAAEADINKWIEQHWSK